MKTVIFLSFISAFILLACGKDKFTTAPQVTVKSITPSTVEKGNTITMNVKFTDKEGDIQDTALIIQKFFNASETQISVDTSFYDLTNNSSPVITQGELEIKFIYGEFLGQNTISINQFNDRDTVMSFGIILIDKAKNRSNYSESRKITFKKI